MLYHLLTPFKDNFSALNLFEYITFRTAIAAIAALIISFIIGPLMQFLEVVQEAKAYTNVVGLVFFS